eukprot:CAMPEP_0204341554 /NCGR_PEP_ID=MMETSP0469-20131031/23461_1 /ASSEMBLY_ACC=CAM_ASM_000384 /TAXON_ID=2969 /ORGANISM="Oxyrrhis marina" /LENGTH=81 /DNA_ID=CAMNT_0051326305 /DNA_START=214 /DNA_END=456 /DNA_ORIENTATION=+
MALPGGPAAGAPPRFEATKAGEGRHKSWPAPNSSAEPAQPRDDCCARGKGTEHPGKALSACGSPTESSFSPPCELGSPDKP